MSTILITDDDTAICRTLQLHYEQKGFGVRVAHSPDEAMPHVLAGEVDAVISDVRMPGRDGFSMLKEIHEKKPDLPVIIMTAFHDLDTTVRAMQGGAADYIPKPIDVNEMDIALERVLSRGVGQQGEELQIGAGPVDSSMLVGQSHGMKEIFKQIALVAQSPVTVLIQGESGTGKELVARAIHKASPNHDQPFMAVNCAALVETLLESEMFGHERGAFTGAVSTHVGKVELVGDGTLFLDEIGELSPAMQGKLLRVLEAREYSPVGSSQVKSSKARFIAATNLDLDNQVQGGLFREDLFYRLNVVSIGMPPLRERRADIPLLVEHLMRRINRDVRRNIRSVAADCLQCLKNHDWPGNIRELDNVLMKAVVMERGNVLTATHLSEELRCARRSPCAPAPMPKLGEDQWLSLKELERRHIVHVLNQTGWHKGKTCEILGVSRPRLERRIKEFGLTSETG
ncbi:sigma-54 dependent transcriptional regulator [Magnetospira sp. QH-2]|uniref:sigma-54-dependent transcriptional regulator n=1 Tax=Magnetospira sp. (strain QH-2) TaxID=1288970 RepID=UPI0003E81071|nr:sigma-54 dependent transcriptional regulator [Magnetospira sp. QH-2]CCQ75088.1 putative response regulator [Magnetospira sp. QH-2]